MFKEFYIGSNNRYNSYDYGGDADLEAKGIYKNQQKDFRFV